MPYIIDQTHGGHITSPVGTDDLKKCFAVVLRKTVNGEVKSIYSLDVSANCTAEVGDVIEGWTVVSRRPVNIKSARKPVYMAKIADLTDSDLATGRADAVSGHTISYGIKIVKSSAVEDFIDFDAVAEYFPVKDAPWEYDKPVKDGINVFRITDFINYWHSADWAMGLTLPAVSNIYVPQQSGEAGQAISFSMNWDYNKYQYGWMSPQQVFAAIQNYYPSILLTCYYQGGSWNYAKSAEKSGGGYFTIGEIGASSAQSGCTVSINTKDIYDTIGSSNPNSILEGRKWTACWVLLPTAMSGKAGGYQVFFPSTPANNKQVVRLQLPSPSTVVDRKVLTIVPKKKTYISSISVAVTVVKQSTSSSSGGFHRWNVASIVLTFEKETSDTISFVLKGIYSCQVGSAYGQGSTDGSGRYTINNNVSVTGTGTKTVTLTFPSNTIWYDPTSAESYSNVIRFSGTLYLENSTFGNWQGSYGIEAQPSEPFGTLTRNINLS